MKLQTLFEKSTLYRSRKVNDVLQFIWKNFSTTGTSYGRKKAVAASSPKIIVPGNCRKYTPPIISAECRVAVVVGGCSNSGLGLVAAEQLLHHGAKRVILADASGASACERLCKAYGKGRAKFYPCDPKNSCQIDGIFKSFHGRDEKVSILVNDLDAIQSLPDSPINYCPGDTKLSIVRRITNIAMEFMPSKCKSDGGIIVNCASILGFMGWPDNPEPVYCGKEPAIEASLRLAESFPVDQTGIRLVALCPSNRSFEAIGLPDIPDGSLVRDEASSCQMKNCTPDPCKDRKRIGRALLHVMAEAPSGTGWLVEPPFTVREKPKLLLPLAAEQLGYTERDRPIKFVIWQVNEQRGGMPNHSVVKYIPRAGWPMFVCIIK